MIVNTGGRTDTVQYYSDWLLRRFEEGYALSRNPLFPHRISRLELNPEVVDCVVFCSKSYRPILPRLHEITDRFNSYCYYTITAYGRDIEPGVPSVEESMRTLADLAGVVGKQRIAWRYDPVLLTKEYTVERHLKTFEHMARTLAPYIDRCIFSFVEIYEKVKFNMPELIMLTEESMDELARGMGEIASRYGIRLQACGTDKDFSRYGISPSGCMTLDILGSANHVTFRTLKHRGMRHGCHCMEARDIGAYDSCPNGCKYCYANKDPRKAAENFKSHNPESPLLLGSIGPDDTITRSVQKSFLSRNCQLELFGDEPAL